MTNMSVPEIEASLQACEEQCGVRITIIDREGFFHDADGRAIFGRERHTHQTNPCCATHFDMRCVDHCRHHCNTIGEKKKLPFETNCWKGVSEIAIPLMLHNKHLGTLFLGQWASRQAKDRTQITQFSKRFIQFYKNLQKRSPERIKQLKIIGRFLADALVLQINNLKQGNDQTESSRQKQIKQFIQQESGPHLNIHELAAYLHISPSRCSHLVKELFNMSLHQLILNERIRRAQLLLRMSDRSAAEIADIVGFSDQYYFSKVFKAACGMPPGQYRKQAQSL